MNCSSFSLLVILILISVGTILLPVAAKDTVPVTGQEIAMAEFFYPYTVVSHIYHRESTPQWTSNDTFLYTDIGRESTDYVLVNANTGHAVQIVDSSKLAHILSNLSTNKISPANLSRYPGIYNQNTQLLTLSLGNSAYSFNHSAALVTTETLSDPIQAGVRSPDGNLIAYVTGDNLNLYNTRTETDSPLTTDGTSDHFYGKRSDTVRYPATETRLNPSPEAYLSWSPDSAKIRTFRVNQRNVSPLYLLENAPANGSLRPVLYSYRFAIPGDESVPMYEPIVIDLINKSVIPMRYKPQPEVSMMDTDTHVLQWWSPDSSQIYSVYYERGEKTLRFLIEDPISGDVKELINETGSTYRESSLQYADTPNVAVIPKSGDIIWFSERDGWAHLYLYDKNGNLKNQITKGEWVVRKLQLTAENQGEIYFTASGKEKGNPYYQYLYKVNTDGSNLTLLTPEKGDHLISFSPDGKFFTDSYSRVDLPPVFTLRRSDGSQIMELASADISYLKQKGWKPPDQVTMKARNGITDIYGLLFKPTDYNPLKKYPIVDIVYPGPYTIVSATRFPSDLSWNSKIFWTSQMLAELGFIVINMDGMGTAYRSKGFHDFSYGHLSDAGLPDHITGITQLASMDNSIDLKKVGIYGKSAGGFMAAQAMLTYPKFFSVGVAASGDMDCRLYGSFWGEKYEGMPNGTNYLEQITKDKAANLSGKLLIMTGEMDDNVHPAMTTQLEEALITANRSFDMFHFPEKNHDLNYDPYYMRKMLGYFVKNL